MKRENSETNNQNHEEIFHEHEIYIEPNPDHYRGGFVWSVCKGECELDCGLSLTIDDALNEAKKVIRELF
ncbi:hypothetical protein ACO0K0_16270 [Undibacterium sp. SXout11W]|uniref:hypothetical protein n=1 Tax=Undibacterium sp. SXout11W TaxID=3413050 RepID=UPI003BF32B6A